MAVKKSTQKKDVSNEPQTTVDEEKKARAASNRKAKAEQFKKAKAVIQKCLQEKVFDGLISVMDDQSLKKLKDSLSTLSTTVRSRAGANEFLNQLNDLFPSVDCVVHEFDVFKATRMGYNEVKKRYNDLKRRCDDNGVDILELTFIDADKSWKRVA